MTQEQLISVIIPVYNEEKIIGRLIEKLLPLHGLEIIVSDGGSRDATPEIGRAYPVIFLSGEAGRARQMNLGAQAAGGEILFFLHADSDPELSVFAQIRQAVQQGFCWGCCTLEYAANGLIYRSLDWAAALRAKVISSCFGDQGIFCTRALFNQLGGFPELPLMEDLEFSRRAAKLSKPAVLPAKIMASPRRFQKYGLLHTIYKIQIAKWMYYRGKPIEEIAAYYRGEK